MEIARTSQTRRERERERRKSKEEGVVARWIYRRGGGARWRARARDGWCPPVDSFTNLLAKQTARAHPVIIADGVSSAAWARERKRVLYPGPDIYCARQRACMCICSRARQCVCVCERCDFARGASLLSSPVPLYRFRWADVCIYTGALSWPIRMEWGFRSQWRLRGDRV